MTPEQQSRADHLALVAAPIYAGYKSTWRYDWMNTDEQLMRGALKYAEALQRAAEERVLKT